MTKIRERISRMLTTKNYPWYIYSIKTHQSHNSGEYEELNIERNEGIEDDVYNTI